MRTATRSDQRGEAAGDAATLRVQNVSKTFLGQTVLHGVDLELRRGEIRALLGENGSGKSTLIKILAGRHQPDHGATAWVRDEPLHLGSTTAAHRAGLRFVHQDLGLVQQLDVVDNLALGSRYVGRAWLNNRREAASAWRLLDRYGADIDVRAPVASLSPAERTIVAIVRALRDEISDGVLVLDEPTATLSAAEISRLFDVMRAVAADGTALLYVTHRLQEVFDVVDDVTVLRDGFVVADAPVQDLTEQELIQALVGRSLDDVFAQPARDPGAVVLATEELTGIRVRDVSIRVHRGEIVGFAGVEGSGREELPQLLSGASPWRSGRMTIGARRFDRLRIRDALRHGLGYAGHRDKGSAIRAMNVRENLTLPQLPAGRGRWLSTRREARGARPWLERLDVRPAEPERPLALLSGGNQQKVVLAKWLRFGAEILILEDPTRGVDIGAKAGIYQIMAEAAKQGTSFLVFSSDAEELAGVCDRVIVLRHGRVVAELDGSRLTEDAVVAETISTREDIAS